MLEVFVVEVQNWRVIHLNKTTSAKIHCEEILFNFYKGDSKASTIKFFFVPNLGIWPILWKVLSPALYHPVKNQADFNLIQKSPFCWEQCYVEQRLLRNFWSDLSGYRVGAKKNLIISYTKYPTILLIFRDYALLDLLSSFWFKNCKLFLGSFPVEGMK